MPKRTTRRTSVRAGVWRACVERWVAGLVFLLVLSVPARAQDVPEAVFWERVRCEVEAQVQAYLETYPSGAYAAQARACLEQSLGLDRAARMRVQRGLIALNYPAGAVDGLFGPVTRGAIRRWQQAKGFAATGYLTRAQADALIARGLEVEAASRELINSLGMEFVRIEAGEFVMGSTNGGSDEAPVHRVRLSQAFDLGKYEVTQAQWEAVMGTNPSDFSACGGTCPVESVSWEDVQTFIGKLNALERVGAYRLPTEAEWEYAARAGTQTAYSFGEDAGDLDRYGWYDENSDTRTHPVGRKRPNGWGLYDVHGNVWEWVADWYGGYSSDLVTDPHGSATGAGRVYRGGGWNSPTRYCRAPNRLYDAPGDRINSLGFRLARTP